MAERSRQRLITPPEGVPLEMQVARVGDRLAAFLFDALIQFVLFFIVGLAFMLSGESLDGGGGGAIAFLLIFLIRSFYFIGFETRWQGRTPGKKRAKIRVMDAQGGPLRTDAIIVRNLMREVEVWIPLALLVAPETFWPDAPWWARYLFGFWTGALLCLPLFNRDRLRPGDMVAGTLVVEAPKAVLLPDLGGQRPRTQQLATAPAWPEFTFTDAQLDVYGIYELQVLEDLLRRTDPHRRKAFAAVAQQIVDKIGWTGGKLRPEPFLRAFYVALRGRLEGRMLLGERKADKHA
ncbi:MAG: RDD family protein [Planctomycetota bacterium]